MKEYAYILYQIKDPKTEYAWESWQFAKDKISITDYDGTYYGHISGEDPITILESLFEIFNVHRPEDFTGASMSTSDIVVLIDDIGGKWYYCDSIGWKDVTEFLREGK